MDVISKEGLQEIRDRLFIKYNHHFDDVLIDMFLEVLEELEYEIKKKR